MAKTFSIVIFLTLIFPHFSYCQIKQQNEKASASMVDTTIAKNYWLTPQNMSPLRFLDVMKTNDKQTKYTEVVTMEDAFPNNWLTKKDVDTLIKLVTSKEKCSCFVNPLSSYIPTNDSADVGGYAIELIKSYQKNKKVQFGLYACPKTNKSEAKKIISWWTNK